MRTLCILLLLGSASAAPVTFVKLYSNAAQVLQWTEASGNITGTFQQVFQTDTRLPELQTTTQTFTGLRSENTFTFQFSQSLLGFTDTRIWTGTLNGNTLNVTAPATQGGLNTVAYTRSTTDAYNAAVKTLTTQVTAARTQFEQQEAQRRTDEAIVRAQSDAVSQMNWKAAQALNDAKRLQSTTERLSDRLTSFRERLPDDLDRVVEDYDDLLESAKEAETCYEVSVVQGYKLGTLKGYDRGVLTDYVADTLTSLEREVREAQATIVTNQLALAGLKSAAKTAATVNPRAKVSLTFSISEVNAVETALQQGSTALAAALSAAQGQYRSVLTEVDTRIAQAQRVAAALTCQK